VSPPILRRKGVDRRDVHRSFFDYALSARRNYSVNIPSVNAFPNGNQNATCGTQVPQIIAYGICKPYLWDKRFVVGGTCNYIGDAAQSYTPINCN
jgi:hypothetical protein